MRLTFCVMSDLCVQVIGMEFVSGRCLCVCVCVCETCAQVHGGDVCMCEGHCDGEVCKWHSFHQNLELSSP